MKKKNGKKSPFLLLIFLFVGVLSPFAEAKEEEWDTWVAAQVQDPDRPVLQKRQISKAGHFQIVGPLFGIADRRDLYNTFIFSLGGRFHFSEIHGWEIFRINYTLATPTDLNTEIQEKTSFHPDVQLSRFQVGSSYIFSPIYGKYAWGSDHLIYFDIFASFGAGVRFADNPQFFGETGIGMNHYLFSNRISILPEFRLRAYSEQRTRSTLVFESMFQIGTSWLF